MIAPYPEKEDEVRGRFERIVRTLDERGRRLFAANEAVQSAGALLNSTRLKRWGRLLACYDSAALADGSWRLGIRGSSLLSERWWSQPRAGTRSPRCCGHLRAHRSSPQNSTRPGIRSARARSFGSSESRVSPFKARARCSRATTTPTGTPNSNASAMRRLPLSRRASQSSRSTRRRRNWWGTTPIGVASGTPRQVGLTY